MITAGILSLKAGAGDYITPMVLSSLDLELFLYMAVAKFAVHFVV